MVLYTLTKVQLNLKFVILYLPCNYFVHKKSQPWIFWREIINKAILDNNISNLFIRDEKDADYVILTNRIILTDDVSKKKLKKCIDYVDQELITVKRLGNTLAIFGKKI